jgi:hypothetical protein
MGVCTRGAMSNTDSVLTIFTQKSAPLHQWSLGEEGLSEPWQLLQNVNGLLLAVHVLIGSFNLEMASALF